MALSDLSLETRSGEIFGLLGPNGAGKTTFLKILTGLVLPTSGRALVIGVDVAQDDRAVKRSIGFVTSDERSFYWRLSGRENLAFFARLYGPHADSVRPASGDLLRALDMGWVCGRCFMIYFT